MSALAGDSVSPPLRVPGGRGSLCATVIYKDQGTLGGTRGDPGNPEMVSVQGQPQRWAREAPGAGRSGLCWTSLPTVKSGACRPAFPGALLRPRSPSANWQPTPPPPAPRPRCLARSLCSATSAPGPQPLWAALRLQPRISRNVRLQGGSSQRSPDSASGFVCESSCGMRCLQFLLPDPGCPFSREVFKYLGSRVSTPSPCHPSSLGRARSP